MSKRDDKVYLLHIRDAIGRIQTYLQDMDKAVFFERTLVQAFTGRNAKRKRLFKIKKDLETLNGL